MTLRFHPSFLIRKVLVLLFALETSMSSKVPSQDHQSLFHYLVLPVQIEMRQTLIGHFDLFLKWSIFADEGFVAATPAGLGQLSLAD